MNNHIEKTSKLTARAYKTIEDATNELSTAPLMTFRSAAQKRILKAKLLLEKTIKQIEEALVSIEKAGPTFKEERKKIKLALYKTEKALKETKTLFPLIKKIEKGKMSSDCLLFALQRTAAHGLEAFDKVKWAALATQNQKKEAAR